MIIVYMGLETDLRKETRMTRTREAILTTLKVGSLVAMVVIAPNVAGLLGKAYSKSEYKKTHNAMRRLRDKGMITFKSGYAAITAKGRSYLALRTFQTEKPRRWDKKWRIVIFDIPEKRKEIRNTLRDALRRIGFAQLQRSTWIFPYDCEEIVTLIKTDCRVGKEVVYVIADRVENDAELRREFGI